jgi:hypothetical protein
MRGKILSSGKGEWIDVLKVGVPAAIAFVVAFTDGIGKLLAPLPLAAVYANTLFSAVMVLLCGVVILVKNDAVRAVFASEADHEPVFEWRFSDKERVTAKIALVPLFLIFCYAAWDTMPNGWVGREMVSGFFCNGATGEPIHSGEVEIRDRLGNPMSLRNVEVDSTGFFYGKLEWWTVRPASIDVAGNDCKTVTVPVDASEPVSEKIGCPSGPARVLPKAHWKVWNIPCQSK